MSSYNPDRSRFNYIANPERLLLHSITPAIPVSGPHEFTPWTLRPSVCKLCLRPKHKCTALSPSNPAEAVV